MRKSISEHSSIHKKKWETTVHWYICEFTHLHICSSDPLDECSDMRNVEQNDIRFEDLP